MAREAHFRPALPSAALVVAALLLLVGVEGAGSRREIDTSAHLSRVRAAAVTIPYSVGDWLGRDVPSPPAAIALLRPNVIFHRAFENLVTGESAVFLFVDCGDARDLIGHYPPVCYPAHGQSLVAAAPRDWNVGGEAIGGTRYRFRVVGGAASQHIVVDSFMVLPTGTYGRDMDAVRDVARDPGLRRFGAAGVQIVTDGWMGEERRDEVLRTLTAAAGPLLRSMNAETMLAGAARGETDVE